MRNSEPIEIKCIPILGYLSIYRLLGRRYAEVRLNGCWRLQSSPVKPGAHSSQSVLHGIHGFVSYTSEHSANIAHISGYLTTMYVQTSVAQNLTGTNTIWQGGSDFTQPILSCSRARYPLHRQHCRSSLVSISISYSSLTVLDNNAGTSTRYTRRFSRAVYFGIVVVSGGTVSTKQVRT